MAGSEWPPWPRVDDRGLARYVTPRADRWLALPESRFDLSTRIDHNATLVSAIYDALVVRGIHYDVEEYHPSAALQVIRTPAEVLVAPRRGTCLDLAALFCGLCLASELLPLLVVIEGHALAAVSLTHGVRDWDGYRPGRALCTDAPLTDAAALRGLVDDGSFVAVECTGFAASSLLAAGEGALPETWGRVEGLLSYERAVAAGREQLEQPGRPFRFAIDVAVAHFDWRIEPHPLAAQPGAWATDIFNVLAGAPSGLAAHLRSLDFRRLVDERTRGFVGREFVFAAVDRLLADPDFPSGYILLRGEPGIGKTALLSRLVQTRGYVHHFNIAPQNIRSAATFLGNLCAQLIVRHELDHPALPPEATTDSAFLGLLLAEAAERAAGQPVVVLVDALDEADDTGLAPEANRLYLPPVLPAGVFFVLTSREQIDYRLDVDRREDIYLRDDDPRNLADVRSYVRAELAAHSEVMDVRLREWGIDADAFIELVTDRSQGNFMYLVHVLGDIRTGRISANSLDDVGQLPRGLRAYYERHWRTMRAADRARFEQIYEPVLRILAAVREPVEITQIADWTNVERARIREVIREWRPFLNETTSAARRPLYRIYHASFQDFLAEEGVGLQPSHERIAVSALAKIPGFLDSG